MQLSQVPAQIVEAWASGDATKTNPIPVPSQISITPGAASWTDGFPPLCATPIASGGIPPSKADMNGGLYQMSAIDVWMCAGGGFPYNAAFQTAIGGYPQGARVLAATGLGYWVSTVDNNMTDPDTGGAGWASSPENAITALTGDVTATGPGSVGATLAASGVTAGSYTKANVTVDAKGRLTSASSSSSGKQVFTSSGTFTIPTGASSTQPFRWTIVGGGGAGGGGASGVSGAGGGAGGTARVLATGYIPGNTITVTIGSGGTGSAGSNGANGGASQIASGTQTITTVTANGGGGGGAGGSSPAGYAGLGGSTTSGDADSSTGGDGGVGTTNSASQGATGGASSYGGGGAGGVGGTNNNGNNARCFGSGGGGGSSNVATAGGSGAGGIIVVEW